MRQEIPILLPKADLPTEVNLNRMEFMTTGLVLTGGGARVAYQVGVLKGIATILPRTVYNPFPIITGTSAGAINAMSIAGRPGSFRLRMRKLETIWRNLHASDIYRTDFIGVTANIFHVLASLLHSGYGIGRPISLLNNQPLKQLLNNYIKFKHLETAIDSRELQAIAVTAMNYASGQSITFFQGHSELQNWSRARRKGKSVDININHLMASTAIPNLFPSVEIDGTYYGDGALRQLKPMSPALHMGAKKLLTISVSNSSVQSSSIPSKHSPSIAAIIGHMFSSAFTDAIESDLESLQAINRLAKLIPESQREAHGIEDLSPIEALHIAPSQSIDAIACQHLQELPITLRMLLKLTGATDDGDGINAASYLLFEPGFCRRLIDLGYQDAFDNADQIKQFFDL